MGWRGRGARAPRGRRVAGGVAAGVGPPRGGGGRHAGRRAAAGAPPPGPATPGPACPPAAGSPAEPTGAERSLTVLFPTPAGLADADLSGLGLTTGRQATLRALAAACAAGRINLDAGADPEETAARLAELPGVGPWTTAYILMRAAGDPDAFPGTDLGLRRAMERLGCEPGRADRWRPWRAYAALHLWTTLADIPAPAGPPARATGAGTHDVVPSIDSADTGQE